MVIEKRDSVVKIEILATPKDTHPSYRYVNDFPAALAYVKACCGETNVTSFGDDWIELESGEKRYLIMKELIDNFYDIRDEYPEKF